MKIIVDAFGGDNAPLEIIKGCNNALKQFDIEIVLVGSESKIKECVKKNNISLNDRISIRNAQDVISMSDSPMDIMKSKNQSSMAEGLKMLHDDEGDAFISAGNSGALTVGATLIAKRIKGIKRCAIAPIIPNIKSFFMLIDGGANVECRPEILNQFGIMGSIYMEKVMKVKNPRVGLANIGTEVNKGDNLRIESFEMLSKSGLNFIGNVEARDIPINGADVIVTDGFTGNIILKMYEGMAKILFSKFKEVLTKNFKTKLGALLIKKELIDLKKTVDYNEYGGAPLIGISKPVFKAHGSSTAKTIQSVIRLTKDYVKEDVIANIINSI